MSSEPQAPLPQAVDTNTISLMNLTLLDPPRWGWTASGSIADVLPSHERARRKRARTTYFAEKRQRERDPARIQQYVNSTQITSIDLFDDGQSQSLLVENGGSGDAHAKIPIEQSQIGGNIGVAEAMRVVDESHEGNSSPSHEGNSSLDFPMEGPTQFDNSLRKSRDDGEQAEIKQHGNFSSINEAELIDAAGKSNSYLIASKIHPSALNRVGVLDMFTYHRGREGQEARDEKTGELLFDVEPTDTNFGWTEPNLNIPISIEFPLQDLDENPAVAAPTSQEALPYYTDVVEWDLSDSSTPSPLEYAQNIANEFGLSFGQTVDLGVSIQSQIDDFLRTHVSYSAPITIRDPSGLEREQRKLSTGCLQLYGCVAGVRGYSGFHLAKKQRALFSRSVFTPKASSNKPKPTTEDEPGNNRAESGRPASPRMNYYDSSEIENEYLTEIRKRARAETEERVRQIAAEEGSGSVSALKILESGNCHICHKRSAHVAQFPCLIHSHIYCSQHCKAKLGIIVPVGDDPPYKFGDCPICSLSCGCIKCWRRLYARAGELKSLREANGTAIEDIVLNQIVPPNNMDTRSSARARSQPVETRRCNKMKRPTGRQGQDDEATRAVVKVPVTDFPREVCGGRDLDPGTPTDYLTVYTSEGLFFKSHLDRSSPENLEGNELSSESSLQEDGNVDYCQKCRIPGNLLCCDVCPRAYHPQCVEAGIQVQTPWECPDCIREKEGLAEDLITGQTSLQRLCVAFAAHAVGDGYQQGLQVLSILHDMVVQLINYDFGETFGQPVDLLILGYREMIKKPMDLGTIRDSLFNGTYEKLLSANGDWDEVVLAVLQDIELVWHNCFTFNREGSAIYRMAEVLRRRSLKIRDASFSHLVNEKVKTQLANYVAKCEAERGKVARPQDVVKRGQVQPRGNARYKITVKWPKGGLSRPVAVLDPDSGIIVKIYSTMRAAGIAAAFLAHNLKHACEWKNLTELSVKGIIHRCSSDSSIKLFGYRWLLLDDLRERKVHFPEKEAKTIVEMVDATGSYLFLSVEDALSYSGLPKHLPIDSLRRDLMELTPGAEFTSLAGRSFRISTHERLPSIERSRDGEDTDISLISGSRQICSEFDDFFQGNVVVVKEDIVARRKLAGFVSIQNAYLDWVVTCDSSPITLNCEARTEDHFREFYLDGNRNVDGIVWRSTVQVGQKDIAVEERAVVAGSDLTWKSGLHENCTYASDKSLSVESVETIALGDSFVLPATTGIDFCGNATNDNNEGHQLHMNGCHKPNQTDLLYLPEVSDLEEAVPTTLSKVDNLESRGTPGKLATYDNFMTELLQPRQATELLSDGCDSQKLIKTFRQ